MNGLSLNNLKSPHQVFHEEGILFYPKIFEGEELERLRIACEFVLGSFREELQSTDPQNASTAIVMRHLNDPHWHQEHREHWKVLMETVADPRCLGPVEQIFRGPSLFRTLSLFFNPQSGNKEGDWHRDQQFVLPSEVEVKEYFDQVSRGENNVLEGVQFQIALEETEDIEYVPFSAARYDSPQEEYIRCTDDRSHNREGGMPNAMRVRLRAGDAIVFNAAGLHRGRYHADKPRRTLMLTYTPRHKPTYDGYSYQPWILEPGHLNDLSPRARAYFEDFISTYCEFWQTK
jgi:hypothetical protein